MTKSKVPLSIVLATAVFALAGLAGCEKRPADAPMAPSTSTTPAPMPPASAASQ